MSGAIREPDPPDPSGGASPAGVFEAGFVLKNRREDIERLQQSLLAEAARRGYDETSCFAIRLALEEAVSNGFKHGNKADPEKTVSVRVRVDASSTEIDVQDEGEGFNPETIPDPTVLENIEIPCGRGIVLMRAYMTTVSFHPPGNRVHMTYMREAPAEA